MRATTARCRRRARPRGHYEAVLSENGHEASEFPAELGLATSAFLDGAGMGLQFWR